MNARKFLFVFVPFALVVTLLFFARKMRKTSQNNTTRFEILERAREAKKVKSILKETENLEKSSKDLPIQSRDVPIVSRDLGKGNFREFRTAFEDIDGDLIIKNQIIE